MPRLVARTRITADQPDLRAAPDLRLMQMRRLLSAMTPRSPADALRLLREAFPDVPLDKRVRALADLKRH